MKYSGYLFCAFVIVSLVLFANDMRGKYYKEKERSNALESSISNLNQEICAFKVRLDDSISCYAARVNTLQMTQENIKARYDNLLRSINARPKDVQNMAEIGMSVADTVYVPVEIDVFGGIKTSYNDNFTSIAVNITDKREASISYDIRDSVSVINIQRKHSILFGLIKWKETEKTTVISHNPKSRIVGVTSIDVIK